MSAYVLAGFAMCFAAGSLLVLIWAVRHLDS